MYQTDNTFQHELFVPLDATSVDLTITNAGLTSPTTTIQSFADPITDYQWDVDLHPGDMSTFILFGQLTQDGVPVTTEPELTFEIVGYSYTDWDHPYQEEWRREFTTPIFPDGHYGVGWNDVPASVTLIRATVKVNGADDGWSRGYTDLTIGGTNQRTFDIELGASRLRYGGNIVLAPYAQDMTVHMPADTAWIGTVYYDHNSGGTGGGEYPPGAFGGITADETHHC
jgi:hypothetical protein